MTKAIIWLFIMNAITSSVYRLAFIEIIDVRGNFGSTFKEQTMYTAFFHKSTIVHNWQADTMVMTTKAHIIVIVIYHCYGDLI